MSRLDEVNELIAKRNQEPTIARVRIEKLLDKGSFVEVGRFNDEAGVVTGYGTIDGRLVYTYAQENAVNYAHAKKIGRIYELALKMGAPVVGIMDSKGVVIEDGLDAFEAFGMIFKNQSDASGVIPQISVVVGDCMGIGSLVPILSDFVIMSEDNAKLFMMSPSVLQGQEAKSSTYNSVGGADAHMKNTGLVHCTCKTDDECFETTRELFSYLPDNNLDGAFSPVVTDDLNREDEALNTIVPEDNESEIDMRYIISSVADNGKFFEIHKDFAENAITVFAKLDGITVGILACTGTYTLAACHKSGEFVKICDAFNIPVITLTDVKGYNKSFSQEMHGLAGFAAKLLSSFTNATVPKINVIIRNGIGNSYLIMNSKHVGADIVYAWPSAKVALMDKEAQVKILGTSSEEYDNAASPYSVAAKGYIDNIIIPASTRKRLISAVEMLLTKRESKPARKHSCFEF
jgi:acetyl-CoA carboxylase carboxyltransferase component